MVEEAREVESVSEQARGPMALSVEGLSLAYDDDTLVLENVSFEVEEGAFALLTGGTGQGKTSLLRQLKPEIAGMGQKSGEIRVFGRLISDLSDYECASEIGFVMQNSESQIVCDTVLHELAFGLENLGIDQATMRRRVAEVAHFFGIEPWLDRSTDALSGGQKQLLSLAGVLAMHPRLLLLDEPTAQLDPIASKNFLHALFRVNRELGITVLMATHEIEAAAEYASVMLELEEGKVQAKDLAAYVQDLRRRKSSLSFGRLQEKEDAAGLPGCSGLLGPCGNAEKQQNVLEMQDAYVRYGKKNPFVLRGADLQMREGEVRALLGGNAAGKSTMLSALSGTLKCERGLISNKLRNQQMLMPQNPQVLFTTDSVAEELGEWQKTCGYSDETVRETAERLRLASSLEKHPYDLSGGQQQLLAFAKAILTRPKLFLLDEPTKGLDTTCRMLLADELMRLSQEGVSILMATHDLSFAVRVADTVSLLFDGQIACTQETGEFFEENLFYRPIPDRFFSSWKRPAKTCLDER